MQKNIIILTVGISNCGKTTWVNEFIKDNPNYLNLNRDDCRAGMHTVTNDIKDYKFSKTKELEVTEYATKTADLCVEKNYSLVISDTNLNPKTRNMWKSWANENDYEYCEKVFDVEPHICKDRNIKRNYSVPPYVIDNQYKQLRAYLGIKPYVRVIGKSTAVIFDMDGTLSDMVGIRKPYEWKECINDKPRKDIIDMLNMYSESNYIIILSGRDSVCRPETEAWLANHRVTYDCLYMRDIGDNRSDPIIKEEIFNRSIAPYYDVMFVVDDRQRMVNHWRNMGVTCLQVQNGDF
jgi:predicted kinase